MGIGLQDATFGLRNATGVKKCERDYKVWRDYKVQRYKLRAQIKVRASLQSFRTKFKNSVLKLNATIKT